MWARVVNGAVAEMIGAARSLTVGSVQYPENIFTLWQSVDLAAIGIYPVVIDPPAPSYPYAVTGETYSFDAANSRVVCARTYTQLPAPVPQVVTKGQACIALFQTPSPKNAGKTLLDDVTAAVGAAGGATAVWWQYATSIERGSAAVGAIAQTLSLSPAQLDALFTLAAQQSG